MSAANTDSEATFYKYKAKFGGMEVSGARKLKALEGENAKLKKLLTHARAGSGHYRRLLYQR